MPGWMNVSALVKNVTGGNYRVNPSSAIGERDAGVILEEVDKILVRADATLRGHQDILPPEEYASFMAQHRALHMNLQREEVYQRDFNAELARQGRVPSGMSGTKEGVQVRALDLLTTVEAYQSRVMTASQRATHADIPSFPDEEPTPTQPRPATSIERPVSLSENIVSLPKHSHGSPSLPITGPPRLPTPTQPSSSTPASRPYFIRSNLGLMKPIEMPSITGLFYTRGTSSTERTVFEALTHVLQEPSDDPAQQPSDPSKKFYRRNFAYNHENQLINFTDPKLRELSESQLAVDNATLFLLYDRLKDQVADILAKDLD
ncbi:hypothetical protein RhiJN_16455 [Ceratobasidium sp. AG-Ba]|nr:hypothetical protein RhiJN_16455 [Ceratobasidium sp. AG-Ba]